MSYIEVTDNLCILGNVHGLCTCACIYHHICVNLGVCKVQFDINLLCLSLFLLQMAAEGLV